MARSLGIRLGQRSFEIVVLNGSSKQAKLDRHIIGTLPIGSEDPVADSAAAIREAIEKENLPTENVGLVIETGLAAFRPVRLPFSDPAKIEAVLKFEVESQLPQWNVDDVIIDFLVASGNEVESNLIVSAVPKNELERQLAICEAAGLEPLEAELESTAMVNAASHAGLLDSESACLLVHFGDTSTALVLVDGGAVKSIRAMHSGAFAPFSGEETESADPEAHLAKVVTLLRREILRTLSSAETSQPIEAVYIAGYEPTGLLGEEIEGVPVEAIAVLPDTDEDEIEDASRLYVAWGAAMRELGGGIVKPSLRREELRFLGKFERLELPLAVLALLLVTIFSVRVIITHKDMKQREQNLTTWLLASNRYMLGAPKEGKVGRLRNPSDKLKNYALNAVENEVAQKDRFDQLKEIERMLQQEILAAQLDLGQDVNIVQPMSCLDGIVLCLGVLDELKADLGAFSVRKVDADYESGKGSRPDAVTVKLDLTFRGSGTIEATERFYAFLNTLRDKPWYNSDKPVKESVLETGDGIYVNGLTISVDVSKSEFAAL